MKKYTKPSMEIVDLRVEDKITAPTTFYKRGAASISLLDNESNISASTDSNTYSF